MYSYEDRLRAVRLFIKLGKRVGLTIRQLGYPTKNALKHWHREYEQRADLSAGYVRRPELAVEHYLEHGRCLAATVKALGYPSRTLLPAWGRRTASCASHARCGPIPGADACNEPARGRRVVHATRKRADRRTRCPSCSAKWACPVAPTSTHRARLEVADEYVEVRRIMAEIFERNYRCYGYRRMRASLTKQCVNISEKVVQRLMKQECMVAVTRKRRRYGSYLGEISPAPVAA